MSLGDFDSWSGPRRWQERSVIFYGDVRFGRFLRRLKALSLSFPTPKMITIESYGPFLPTTGDKQLCNGHYVGNLNVDHHRELGPILANACSMNRNHRGSYPVLMTS